MGAATAIVKQAYEAFGRGDVPAVLNLIADQVDWEFVGSASLPYAGRRKDKKGWAISSRRYRASMRFTPSSRGNLLKPANMSPCSAGKVRPRAIPKRSLRPNGYTCLR